MNEQQGPLVLKVKGSSLDDGPGIRTVVFFKGCPLSCVWCHNPESKKAGVELSFDGNRCIGCGTCIDLCPVGAVSKDNPHFIDRKKCTLCFACAEKCPAGALEQVGTAISIASLMAEILKSQPFFESSGGGVTLSGGEPLLHMPFVSDLLKRLKERGIHTLIETSGVFNFSSFETLILPYTDTVYMDLKLFDPVEHKKFCGLSNQIILKNFEHLAKAEALGLDFLPRVPLIPGITTKRDNLEGIAQFLKDNNRKTVQLLSYNPTWIDKLSKIGSTSPVVDKAEMNEFMTDEGIEACKTIFLSAGISVLGS